MSAFPLPVDLYIHYCTMINQICQGKYPDNFGLERMKVNQEIVSILSALQGKARGIHMVIRLLTGELIISGSFEDLKLLSHEFPYEQIAYYGLVDEGVLKNLSGIAYG